MSGANRFWEDFYKSGRLARTSVSPLVAKFAPLVPPGNALDLGMGEGRNALFLASRGFLTTGVDFSPVAVNRCQDRAKQLGLSVKCLTQDIRRLEIEASGFSLIISTVTLNFLPKEIVRIVAQNIVDGLRPGGIALIALFSSEDPWASHSASWSFYTRQEVLAMFHQLACLQCEERSFLRHHKRRDNRHITIQYAGRKDGGGACTNRNCDIVN